MDDEEPVKECVKGLNAAAALRSCKRLPVLRLSSLLQRNKPAQVEFMVCRCHLIQASKHADMSFATLQLHLKVTPHGQKFKQPVAQKRPTPWQSPAGAGQQIV
jgi:hypothetical protein